MTRPIYIDTHAHLYDAKFDDDRDEVVQRALAAGFSKIINVSIDGPSFAQCVALADAYPGVCYATVGLHPTSSELSDDEFNAIFASFREQAVARPDVVVAVGEIGFDYYWDTATPARQAVSFRHQLELARELGLPVVIHCRDAWDDTLAVVAEYAAEVCGVFHCFGGTSEHVERALELGWYVSFAGNVSFPKASNLREAAKLVPLDRLFLETDSPYLAAQPVRGRRNEPAFALHTAATLAELQAVDVEEIGRATTANARRLFGFDAADAKRATASD